MLVSTATPGKNRRVEVDMVTLVVNHLSYLNHLTHPRSPEQVSRPLHDSPLRSQSTPLLFTPLHSIIILLLFVSPNQSPTIAHGQTSGIKAINHGGQLIATGAYRCEGHRTGFNARHRQTLSVFIHHV